MNSDHEGPIRYFLAIVFSLIIVVIAAPFLLIFGRTSHTDVTR